MIRSIPAFIGVVCATALVIDPAAAMTSADAVPLAEVDWLNVLAAFFEFVASRFEVGADILRKGGQEVIEILDSHYS